MTKDVQRTESWDHVEREKEIRQGIDLATTLERIEKNFVITDPRLPDNPIVRGSQLWGVQSFCWIAQNTYNHFNGQLNDGFHHVLFFISKFEV